jgi:hypothetical protein
MGTSLRYHDVRIGLRTTDELALREFRELLPPGMTPLPRGPVDRLFSVIRGGEVRGARRFHLLYADSLTLVRTFDWNEVREAFRSEVEKFVAAACRDRVFVHAGVVGLDGRAIVIPGRSGSGKSTLVQAFLRAGATYLSDEYAVVDDRGRVHAFPRQPMVRDAHGRQHRQPKESLRFNAPKRSLPLGLVAVVPYHSAGNFRARDISAARGAFELMRNAPAARQRPDMILQALTRAASGARAVQGTRGDADSAVEELRRML